MVRLNVVPGTRYHKLTIIKDLGRINKTRRVIAKCDCGKEKEFNLNSLRRNVTKSCGCLKQEDISYLIGAKFGKLTIIKDLGTLKFNRKYVLVKCSCKKQTEKAVGLICLKNGKLTSCGCNYIKYGEKNNCFKHGLTNHPLYFVYLSMVDRCSNDKDAQYYNYGGRGIRVDEHWLGPNGLKNFINDMGGSYQPGLSIDRKDNNGPYSKENCRWATRYTQGRNKRNNILISFNNETKCLAEWAEQYQIKWNLVYQRIYVLKWDIERALTTPNQRNLKFNSSNL